jgi:hypothetical protein
LLLELLLLALEPLLEQAANVASAATQPTAPSVRSLKGEWLTKEPPQRCERCSWRTGHQTQRRATKVGNSTVARPVVTLPICT